MIAYLTGKPILHGTKLVVLVNGVGYGVLVSSKVLQQVGEAESVSLFIHTHVREDQLSLFGFLTLQEQQLFELLLGVSGVGPSTALHLTNTNPDQLISAVQEAKVSFFSAVPRVGKKLAQKIIIELRGKLGELKELNLAPLSAKEQTVISALVNLGFNEEAVREAVATMDLEELTEAQAIKQTIGLVGGK
jgi:holliday junction DNA helicase RuvA